MAARRKIRAVGERKQVALPEPAWTARQFAEFIAVELKTVHQWARQGRLPHFRTPGRHLRFRPSDVRTFLERGYDERPSEGPDLGVLAVAGARRRAQLRRVLRYCRVRWIRDPLRALVAAGREPPDLVIFDSTILAKLDPVALVSAIVENSSACRVLWMGPRLPTRRHSGRVVLCSTAKEVGLYLRR